MNAEPRLGYIACPEWVWILIVSLLIILAAALPYIIGYRASTIDQVFSGVIFNRSDTAVHHATMHLGAQGDWVYRLRFTSEAQSGAYIKLGYIFLGQLIRLFPFQGPASIVQSYHLFAGLLGLGASLSLYGLLVQILTSHRLRRLAFVLAFLGSGVGWLQLIVGYLPAAEISPIDFWLIDAYPFFGLLILPHFMLLLALMVQQWGAFLAHLRRPSRGALALAVLAGVFMQTVSPLAAALAGIALIGSWLCKVPIAWRARIRPPGTGALVLVGSAQLPGLIYNLYVLRTDPNFVLLGDAFEVWTPAPSYLVLGFLGYWPLVALGLIAAYRKPSPALTGSVVWLFFAVLMAYNPWVVQRRWLLGMTIPLAIIAVAGLDQVARPWLVAHFSERTLRWQSPLALLFAVVLMLSNIYQVLGYSLVVASQPAGLFDPGDRVAAVDWLASHSEVDQVVLAPGQTALLVASRSALISYMGSLFETLDYDRKLEEVQLLFEDGPPTGWLLDSGADWVIVELLHRDFSTHPHLSLAFQQGTVSVYGVTNE